MTHAPDDPASPPRAEAASAGRGVAAGFVAALALLGLMGFVVVQTTRALIESGRRVVHTHQVVESLTSVLASIQGVETGERGYLLTADARFLEPYRAAPAEVRATVARLRQLVSDNPQQQARLARLEAQANAQMSFASGLVAMADRGQLEQARSSVASGEGKRLMDAVRRSVAEMTAEEERLLALRQTQTEAGQRRTLLALGLGLALCVGLLTSVFGLLRREIGERARVAVALRRSEESLSVTLHSIGDAVLATDTLGNVTRLNGVAETLTGWRLSEAKGRPIAEVFRIVNETTREPGVIPVERVLATGEIHGLANHTVLIARDGTERAIADSAAPIRDESGRVLGVVLVFRDVSAERAAEIALRESRAELDRFFSLSLDFLCIASGDGYFKRVSPAVTDILGWTQKEFLASPFLDFVHPDDRDSTLREVEKQMQRGEKVLQFENRYRHKDGSWRVLSWRSVPQAELMYATARDVTALKQSEARIRQLNADLQRRAVELRESNRELESFSYSVSHDLRAPLRHVQGYVDLLAREAENQLSEKGQRFLGTIAAAGRSMGQLIDDLLAFSRMGRAELRDARVDLDSVVERARADLELALGGRNVVWNVAALPDVHGDPAMLLQVFANLLGNAVKYSRGRDPATIEVGSSGMEQDRVVLYVRDNGAGFDMQYADKLFGVFQRLHRAEEFEGTGIGLANVRRIVVRHGGRVWAESAPGAGATFYFTLKAAERPDA